MALLHRLSLVALTALLPGQDKKPLTAADYGQWESLGGSGTLSPDGSWLAYQVRRSNGEHELRIRELDSEEHETVAHGHGARFSDDTRWLGYLVGVSEEERERLRKDDEPVRETFVLVDLRRDRKVEYEGVDSFRFSENGKHLALHRAERKDQDGGGTDLIVRDLREGTDLCIGNVSEFEWSEWDSVLAMVIDTADEVGGGVQVYDAVLGTLRTLDSHKARYTGLSWREESNDLAFLRITEHDDDEDEQPSHVVFAFSNVRADLLERRVFDHREREDFPAGMRVVSRTPTWHADGLAVFFGIRPWERPPAGDGDDEQKREEGSAANPADGADGDEGTGEDETEGKGDEPKSLREQLDKPAGVDVWHARDVDIIPRQKKTASADRAKSHLCAFWLADEKFVRLADDTVDTVTPLEGGDRALGRDTTRHRREAMFGPELADTYILDTRTGERRRILERNKYVYRSSPDGHHVLFVKDDTWHTYDVRTDTSRPLTASLSGDFINDERGVLTDENPPYGIAGFAEDASLVYLHSRYDVWAVPLDGGQVRQLTNGAPEQLRYRLLDLDPDFDWIDPTEPMYLSVFSERDKRSGFARLTRRGTEPTTLLLRDKRVSDLQKAKHTDDFVFVEQGVDDSPDIFASGPFLAEPRQQTETNPQQSDFRWTPRAERIDYKSARGVALQGALHYPADYQPGKQHPMIVYIYERRSQNLHAYSAPTERHPYNPSVFTSLGYFVYQPDIVYRAQNPGISALECVVPAVEAVLDKGEVDPAKIGLVGHSWGAYQTAFIVTRSNLFAAGVAGAPLTNMMSMSMEVYWNTGSTNARIFHESQGRMDKPFWQDVETYIANSPIFGMDSLETPLLIAFGDEDGAVDWHQGVEMYNAARLAGKQLVMLVYDGENHSLRKKPNQVDYHWRVREWFGHYVKGEPAPKWITKGTTVLEREEQVRQLKKKKKKKKKGGKD